MTEKPKSLQIISDLVLLRAIVGFLGLRKQAGWWDCDFLDPIGLRFLETTFPRTAPKAAMRSTTEAAARVHDQALGRMGSYHLFRLPVELEDAMERAVDTLEWSNVSPLIQARDTALAELHRLAGTEIAAPQGPVQIGVEARILTRTSIEELAAHYQSAFRNGIRSFPYFAAKSHGR